MRATSLPVRPGRAGLRPVTWACTGASVGLLAGVAVLGDSASTPGLGAPTRTPPWDLAAHPSSALVTAALVAAYALGVAGILLGRRDLAAGRGPTPRTVAVAALVAVAVLTSVPPTGSADHLSYLAYGRIAAAGDDPYRLAPGDWRGGTDPVAGAVQPPWQAAPSVYGPVATAVQAAVAVAGGGSLRFTVWLWQLVSGAGFLTVALLLDRLAGADPRRRGRVAVLWTLNPVLLGLLVLGAHVDVLATALAVGAIALVARRPLAAGALLGAAVGTKLPYAIVGAAALWGLRLLPRARRTRSVALGVAGAAAVLVPAYAWAGPHAFDRLAAGARMTSVATPWRAVVRWIGDGPGQAGPVPVSWIALALAAGLSVLAWRRVAALSAAQPDAVTADVVRATLAGAVAWAVTAPYSLPWYDAMVWAPLALVGPSALDLLLLGRLGVLTLAYVPGRVVGLTPVVERVTLGFRRYVAPVVGLGVVVGIVAWARGGRSGGRRSGHGRPQPGRVGASSLPGRGRSGHRDEAVERSGVEAGDAEPGHDS